MRFVIVGPHAGKTMEIHGRKFVKGVHDANHTPAECALLEHTFGLFYSVHREELAPRKQQEYDMENPTNGAPKVPVHRDVPQGTGPSAGAAAAPGKRDAEAAPLSGERAPVDNGGPGRAAGEPSNPLSLADAIAKLDPEDDEHWTSNNLPALDILAALTAGKVARKDVEESAPGHTRAKAREAFLS